ncbi:MAG: UDP-N-acetylmuramoyl-L-alanine--D-glutamate ligase [Phycisphaerales bacterium]|nr:UDP-N-acetylmuramoyl-L-alanine--D-glutamate ligase [Phycisphaerales bacterium]
MHDWSGKRVTVMGLGRFGGGLAVTRYLARRGATVLLTDLADEQALAGPLKQLKPLIDQGKVRLRLGTHEPVDFTAADTVVANPAVPKPWENRYLNAAREAGVPITTEIQLGIDYLDPSRIIAVTGSAGKSTTSAMTHAALVAASMPTILAGNIGTSILDRLDDLTEDTISVLEISSAMLHWLQGFAPAVAVVTNCTENHTDWHGSFDHYQASKRSILAHQPPGAAAILDETLADWSSQPGVQQTILTHSDRIERCTTPGAHNARNAVFAVAAATAVLNQCRITADQSTITQAVREFPGLPHRLSLCHEANGIRFYNDSKCTVPGATLLAISALSETIDPSRIHLIAGGYDKGSDLQPIADLASSLSGLYTIGVTGKHLADTASSNAAYCVDLDSAMRTIMQRTKPGDAILLSPGCASWDQFTNYEQRGDRFRDLAVALTEPAKC